MNNFSQKNKGFTIFFAMLVLGLVLGVGMSIAALAQKHIVLSYFSKQSQVAFYAADTGGECARYWDLKNPDNPSQSKFIGYAGTTQITCAGQSITVENRASPSPGDFTSYFEIPIQPPGDVSAQYAYCAAVTVVKKSSGGTIVSSRGHNLTCQAPISARKVERAIAITY